MPSFYKWTLRLVLFVALFILVSILRAIWPDGHLTSWSEIASIGALLLATVAVSLWAVGAWIGDSEQQRRRLPSVPRADGREAARQSG